MKLLRALAPVFCLSASGLLSAGVIPGDPRLGEKMFHTQNCVACHSISGQGGTIAPDLGKGAARFYSPASMASRLWNHAPAMFDAMKQKGVEVPRLTEEQVGDLYAFFYTRNFFARPGDAGRGKRTFQNKGCAGCHGIDAKIHANAKPVSEWASVSDPILLAHEMWNHSGEMKAAMAAKNVPWPSLTADEFRDVSLYLRTLPGAKPAPALSLASAETGARLMSLKGCAKCHTGANALEGRFFGRAMDEFVAAMWNHAPKMGGPAPELRPEEMQRIAGYLWASQYFEEKGSTAHGETAFKQKGCVTCHAGAGPGPKLSGQAKPNSITLASAVWIHGPEMRSAMEQKRIPWPQLTPTDVTNILTYLNTLP